jgi:transposase
VRRLIVSRGEQKPCLRIVGKMFSALADSAAVTAHRRGALERVLLLLADWKHAHRCLTDARMTAVLDELELTELVLRPGTLGS